MKRTTLLLVWVFGIGCLAETADAQVRKAENARKKQQFEEALGFIDTALGKKPDDSKAFETRARIYQDMAAAATGEAYLSAMKHMMDDFHHAVSLNAKLAENVERQQVLAYVAEFSKGIDAFNSAQGASDQGAKEQFFQSAADFFRGSSIVAPDSVGAYVNWAFAKLGSGDEVGAIEPLSLAREFGPADVDVYNYLSRIYLTNDRAVDAVPLLEEAVSHFPDNAELSGNLLNAYTKSGQIERAIEQYGKAVANNPDNNLYRYNYGSLLLQTDRFDEAIVQLAEVVQKDEAYTDAQYNLGAAHVNKAIAVNVRINELDDDLRAKKDSLSNDEIRERESAIDKLAEERRGLFGAAIGPLEAAKRLAEAEDGRAVEEICRVLYQSYVQTNQMEKVELVEECASL